VTNSSFFSQSNPTSASSLPPTSICAFRLQEDLVGELLGHRGDQVGDLRVRRVRS